MSPLRQTRYAEELCSAWSTTVDRSFQASTMARVGIVGAASGWITQTLGRRGAVESTLPAGLPERATAGRRRRGPGCLVTSGIMQPDGMTPSGGRCGIGSSLRPTCSSMPRRHSATYFAEAALHALGAPKVHTLAMGIPDEPILNRWRSFMAMISAAAPPMPCPDTRHGAAATRALDLARASSAKAWGRRSSFRSPWTVASATSTRLRAASTSSSAASRCGSRSFHICSARRAAPACTRSSWRWCAGSRVSLNSVQSQ
mmetsp:Transcript_25102/g.73329  ORF Transcript_25102/g.73329 Transcript_25102/m.73329 type:complete len:258 (-) Transcript_25102:433-1206(-)